MVDGKIKINSSLIPLLYSIKLQILFGDYNSEQHKIGFLKYNFF